MQVQLTVVNIRYIITPVRLVFSSTVAATLRMAQRNFINIYICVFLKKNR